MRYMISDEIWDVLGSMVERCRSPLGPELGLPDRMFFEAVLYWALVGCRWRDLPGDFGDCSAVYNRLRRWIHSSRLKALFDLMAVRPECEGPMRSMIDSTIVRAHQHPAAGSRPRSSPSPVTRTA